MADKDLEVFTNYLSKVQETILVLCTDKDGYINIGNVSNELNLVSSRLQEYGWIG